MAAGFAFPAPGKLLLLIAAATGARTFGMALNRILDRAIDGRNPRTAGRELPSGKMGLRSAVWIAGAGFVLYVASCVFLGPRILALSPIPALLLAGYPLLKRFTWLCHYGIGLTLGLAPIAAFVAVKGVAVYDASALLLGIFTFFWMSGYDIIYAMQDEKFDRDGGVYSIPGRFGGRTAEIAALLTHAAAMAVLLLLSLRIGVGPIGTAILACLLAVFIVSHLPSTPLASRFFPLSAVAGILGSLAVFFRRM